MSFVGEPYEYDYFISYSHGAFEGVEDSDIKKWSVAFANLLEGYLKSYPELQHDLRVFRDQDWRPNQAIDPSEPLTEELQSSIESSALLSILMSPHYLRSDWCKDELDWWLNSPDPGSISKQGRAIVSRIFYTDEPWPQDLLDKRGHQPTQFFFYDKSKANDGLPWPFDWPLPKSEDIDDAFNYELQRLTRHIYGRLKKIKSQLDAQRQMQLTNQKLRQNGGQTIYLHGRRQQAQQWEQCRQELKEQEFTVLPLEPDPVAGDSEKINEYRQARVNIMSECDAILILTGDDTMHLSQDLAVVGMNDRENAQAQSQKELPCAVLDKTGFSGTDVQSRVEDVFKIGWINAQNTPWNPNLGNWMKQVSS